MNSVLPRKPILSTFTARLKQKVPKIIFATNPCRIKFCDQEIVIFREDLMSRMLRNLVSIKPDVSNQDLKLYVCGISFPSLQHLSNLYSQLVQTIIDQSHLIPLLNSVQPVLSDYDHALRLYPTPTTASRYECLYSGRVVADDMNNLHPGRAC